MKRISCCILTIFIVLSIKLSAQNDTDNTKKYDLLIMHPTKSNIENLYQLFSLGIIQSSNLKLGAVYHEQERLDYQKVMAFTDTINKFFTIEFIKLKGELNSNNVYEHNSLSATFNDLFEQSNGVLFFGGDDMQPALYGEQRMFSTSVYDSYRHYLETSFLYHLVGGFQNQKYIPLLEQDKSYLIWSFCLGMQTLNVACGGTLIQDIPSEIYGKINMEEVLKQDVSNRHKNYYSVLFPEEKLSSGEIHPIIIEKNNIFRNFSDGDTVYIYSNHHQAIEKIGKNLLPMAYTFDKKIIEAVYHSKYPNVVGFQFHPEKSDLYNIKTKVLFDVNDTNLVSYPVFLKKKHSYNFHIQLWKEFSDIIKAL